MTFGTLCCAVCRKEPHELQEYIDEGKVNGMTPRQYVLEEEGTLNNFNKLFVCTLCYIKIGTPSGPVGGPRWTPEGYIDASD